MLHCGNTRLESRCLLDQWRKSPKRNGVWLVIAIDFKLELYHLAQFLHRQNSNIVYQALQILHFEAALCHQRYLYNPGQDQFHQMAHH